MHPEYGARIWSLSGAKRYIREVVENLGHGKHVVLVLPRPILAADPFVPIREHLRHVGYGEMSRILIEHRHADHPLESFACSLGTEAHRFEDEEHLFSEAIVPSKYLFVDGLEECNSDQKSRWIEFISRAADFAQIHENTFSLVCPMKPGDPLPMENVKLAVHPWWAVIHTTEIELFVEEWFRNGLHCHVDEYYWGKSLCLGLAGNDFVLAEKLLDHLPREKDDIVRILAGHLESFSVEDAPPPSLSATRFGALQWRPSDPPLNGQRELVDLWEAGLLDWCVRHGLFIHSSLFAKDMDRNTIQHRFWQGQQNVLFPLIENARSTACLMLAGCVHPEWSSMVPEGPNVQHDIGPLTSCILDRSILRDALDRNIPPFLPDNDAAYVQEVRH